MLKKKFRIVNKILTYLLIFFGVSFISIYVLFFSNIVMPWEKGELVKTTLNWGGLNVLPNDSEIINIEKKGSMFSRQILIEFSSSKSEIQSWIEKSKRLKNNIPEIQNETKIYEIYPGENGAFGGKVEIRNNVVIINMSWS